MLLNARPVKCLSECAVRCCLVERLLPPWRSGHYPPLPTTAPWGVGQPYPGEGQVARKRVN